MQSTANDPIPSVVKRWEEACDLLSSALVGYLDSCLRLNTILGRDTPNGRTIASRIDSTLDALHPIMRQQLAQSTSALSQTRNTMVSSIGFLPEEVLYQIFSNVVYAPEHTTLSMRNSVRTIYRNLHNLLAVCSNWRNIAISRGTLWEIIPAIDDPIRNQAIDLSLERSRGCLLRLAATTTLDGPPILLKTVTENASRLRALNVQGSFSSQITSIVTELLRDGAPNQLLELLLCCSPPKYSQPPRVSNFIVEARSPEQAPFNKLLSCLATIRLSGVQIHWKTTNNVFSDRLVELYVHKVGLGNSDSAMVSFISAVSSASELRDLKIVDVRAYRNSTETTNLTMRPTVTFPKLQSLLLQDLCFNVLEFFLYAISPGSYHSTIALSARAFEIIYSDGSSERVGLDNVTRPLALGKIDTLFLPRGSVDDRAWLKGSEIRKFLEVMPKLRVLKMHGWHFYEDFCSGLCPPDTSESPSYGLSIFKLELLQLTGVTIRNQELFKHMLVTISPQSMILGGFIRSQDGKWAQLTEDDGIVEWLNINVSGFRRVDLNYNDDTASLNTESWQIW
ncbi:F-box-like protein [Rhizoctonia solani 123E]|uniref:F-box-like protein n=1 Tax=Rhizoctonia solani 123E TaxID=1423351 RepID=A0A074RJ67_9AGAM|nr:F-box-like protein [Rhizoctonia solani 123E]